MPRRSAPLLLLATLAVAVPARADEPTSDKRRAAALFDEAVGRFNRAEFAEAARGFYEADRLAPSAVAITNAIAAARKASEHLLVARAAERAIARGDALVEARAAMAEAATRLCRLDLSCEGPSCAMTLDGEGAPVGTAWTLPGTHRITAKAGPAAAEQHIACSAGARYRIALQPRAETPKDKPAPPPRKGLHRAGFFVGVGVTAVLAGATIGSGVDAMAAKRALPRDEAEQAQIDGVLGRARRTDFLLLGAGLAAVGTAALGIWGTDWRGVRAAAAVVPGGAAIAASGRFWGP
jgi:hypothetical protein